MSMYKCLGTLQDFKTIMNWCGNHQCVFITMLAFDWLIKKLNEVSITRHIAIIVGVSKFRHNVTSSRRVVWLANSIRASPPGFYALPSTHLLEKGHLSLDRYPVMPDSGVSARWRKAASISLPWNYQLILLVTLRYHPISGLISRSSLWGIIIALDRLSVVLCNAGQILIQVSACHPTNLYNFKGVPTFCSFSSQRLDSTLFFLDFRGKTKFAGGDDRWESRKIIMG